MPVRVIALLTLCFWAVAGLPARAQDNFWQTPADDKPARAERKKAPPPVAKKAPAPPAPAAQPAESAGAPAKASQPPAAASADTASSAPAAPAPAAPPPGPAAQPPAAAASANVAAEQETAFWKSIKDSKSADEFKAYLKKYPKGTFAELAQIKIKQLQAAPAAATPTPAPQGSPTAAFNAAVKEAQERLYGLNYDIVRFDGIPDEKTERAVRAWQQRAGFPATGVITPPQLARLRQIPQVKVWGAVAFAGYNGAAVVVTGQQSRAKAEGKALADCLVKAGRACNAFAVPETRCGALAYFRQRLTNGNFTVTHAIGQDVTVPGATARALANCNKSEGTAGRCGVLASVCAAGQGNVYAPAYSDAPVAPPSGSAQGAQPPNVFPLPPAPPARPLRRPGEQDT